ARLKEEADAYKARIVAQAQGDAQRFKSVLTEYQKAPQVTRDRMYLETMQQIYGNVTKVLIDSRQGSNLLYLPLDKLMQQSHAGADSTAPTTSTVPTGSSLPPVTPSTDARSRDPARARERDTR
ncbi:MAG: protease modulator HflK, partial [Burkholderiaceae bacterium]